ncbi:hypothetical protein PFICI_09283 [Pestalotiopsis fici W106-1]|uniref:C2H2-type domain-containing protein n=1 Tax=Pestalotiopsis fici (strain W106-1 / CGMCC3.15140) TaxID=1229662 RepID=W3X005_PESFW|nr:uncharacterized protein PFICI_09283 [Pestalotiopsis fici W106-1]ETS79430.1 hypothetical protein PFICI_09283 [Pestalotiopsis fici W106-1]
MKDDVIYQAAFQCTKSFEPLLSDPKIIEDSARFKVWVGNVGASRIGVNSLDFKLRDSSHIKNRILSLLDDLHECLNNADAIIKGERKPWDQCLEDSQVDDNEDEYIDALAKDSSNTSGFGTELDQIRADVAEIVNCLYQLSTTTQAPAPHDQYMIAHHLVIEDAYIRLDISAIMVYELRETSLALATRLAEANARRRRYWTFRQTRNNHKKDYPQFQLAAQEDDPEISSAIPLPESRKINTLDIPVPPPQSEDGTLECPYCFTVIFISTPQTWREHIYSDLRPYICLEESCRSAGQHYLTQNQWMEHVLQHHWRNWRCVFCPSATSFESSLDLRRHLESRHEDSVSNSSQVDILVQSGKQAKKLDTCTACPLCAETLQDAGVYRQHVGRHQEQVALLVFKDIKK